MWKEFFVCDKRSPGSLNYFLKSCTHTHTRTHAHVHESSKNVWTTLRVSFLRHIKSVHECVFNLSSSSSAQSIIIPLPRVFQIPHAWSIRPWCKIGLCIVYIYTLVCAPQRDVQQLHPLSCPLDHQISFHKSCTTEWCVESTCASTEIAHCSIRTEGNAGIC